MGVLIIELQTTFEASAVMYNVASTTQLSFALLASVVTSLCVSKFGARRIVMVGSLITTTGYVAASHASNIYMFFIAYGVVAAVGVSCLVMGSVVPLYEYFDKHKALALGFSMAGYSLGFFIWPPVGTMLFRHYGWRGGLMVLAGLQLNGCVLGAIMRPYRDTSDSSNKLSSGGAGRSKLLHQVKVFLNKHFILFCGLVMLFITGYPFAPTYLPTMAEGLKASATNAALLVSVFGSVNCVSRALHGFLGDVRWFRYNRLTLCIYAFAVAGVNKICFLKVSTYAQLAVFAAIDGYANGAYMGLMFTLSSDLVLLEHRSFAGGIISMFSGTAMIMGSAAGGWLYSYSGGLDMPSVVLGCIQLAASLLTVCLYAHIKLTNKPSPKCTEIEVHMEKTTADDEHDVKCTISKEQYK